MAAIRQLKPQINTDRHRLEGIAKKSEKWGQKNGRGAVWSGMPRLAAREDRVLGRNGRKATTDFRDKNGSLHRRRNGITQAK
jgi:hypothetical protein